MNAISNILRCKEAICITSIVVVASDIILSCRIQRVFDYIGQRLFFRVKKDSGRNDRSLLFRNLYLVTQMDYFAFPTEVASFLYPHLLNTFFPSLDVLL